MLDLEKLAAEFQVAIAGMDEDEMALMAAAVETVLLEKEAGAIAGDINASDILLISAAVVDNLFREITRCPSR